MYVMNVLIHEPLFASYVGLIASGYELSDTKDNAVSDIIGDIREADFEENVKNYFSLARTEQSTVNPYWPRGSSISSASIFITDDLSFESFHSYIEFEKTAETSNQWESPDFISWIKMLPKWLKVIENDISYKALWNKYRLILESRLPAYRVSLEKAVAILNEAGFHSETERIIFVPNLLQAPQIADYVMKDGFLYVIMTSVDIVGMLHETLHPAVHLHRNEFGGFIEPRYFSCMIDEEKVLKYGFTTNTSTEKTHYIEECLVRGVSASLARNVTGFNMDEYCRWHSESGFLLVPSVVEFSKQLPPAKENISLFVSQAIKYHLSEL